MTATTTANNTSGGGANTNANANRPPRARRTRRTPSQMSTTSLPAYAKEPGAEELVIFRGPDEVDVNMDADPSDGDARAPGDGDARANPDGAVQRNVSVNVAVNTIRSRTGAIHVGVGEAIAEAREAEDGEDTDSDMDSEGADGSDDRDQSHEEDLEHYEDARSVLEQEQVQAQVQSQTTTEPASAPTLVPTMLAPPASDPAPSHSVVTLSPSIVEDVSSSDADAGDSTVALLSGDRQRQGELEMQELSRLVRDGNSTIANENGSGQRRVSDVPSEAPPGYEDVPIVPVPVPATTEVTASVTIPAGTTSVPNTPSRPRTQTPSQSRTRTQSSLSGISGNGSGLISRVRSRVMHFRGGNGVGTGGSTGSAVSASTTSTGSSGAWTYPPGLPDPEAAVTVASPVTETGAATEATQSGLPLTGTAGVVNLNDTPPSSPPRPSVSSAARAGHRPSNSTGSAISATSSNEPASTTAHGNSSGNGNGDANANANRLARHRTRSAATLHSHSNSGGSRIHLPFAFSSSRLHLSNNNNASTPSLPMNASTTTLDHLPPAPSPHKVISAPLAHTARRTHIAYPAGGPTPAQIRLLASRESLASGVFGVPFGEAAEAEAVRARRSRVHLGDGDADAEGEENREEEPPAFDFESDDEDGHGNSPERERSEGQNRARTESPSRATTTRTADLGHEYEVTPRVVMPMFM